MTKAMLGAAILITVLLGGAFIGAIGAFIDDTNPDLPE